MNHQPSPSLKGNILIVDDVPANLQLLAQMLSEQGYKTRTAPDGKLALRSVELTLPDLILLDIMMPTMDGYQVCQALKASPKTKEIPVIFISALNEVFDRVKAFEVGGIDYISKPFQEQEVLARVSNQIIQRQLFQQIQQQNLRLASEIVDRKQAESRLKQQFQKEQLLNHLTQSIRSSLNLNIIFTTAVREIATSLGVDYVAILQYFPEKQLWLNISEYRQTHDLQTALGLEIADENNLIADRLQQLETLYIDEINTCAGESHKPLTQIYPGAWLLVPLKVDSRVWGSVCVVKENPSYHWQVFEVELLCAVADSVAIGIKQAELYQESQSYAQQLEAALSELKSTQAELVQKANMASLGQLIAGIAHEINNPTNFIYGNITSATEYARELLHLVQLYRHYYPEPVAEIIQQLEKIEPDFIVDDYPKLMNSIKEGSSRIKQIVLSLRNFSRLGEEEHKAVNIHEGIDNTLVILQHRLRETKNADEIEVIKDYSQLPKVTCYASQLNQVFMNLIANAIDALEKQRSPRRITISTKVGVFESRLTTQSVVIQIADNGCGMSDELRDRIFDPFFSTKPVGSGTGLGLAISHNIVVEKHRGQISCISAPGEGTEFIVQIPLDPP